MSTKIIRIVAITMVFAGLAGGLAGCASTSSATKDSEESKAPASPAYFDEIPADSTFFFAGDEPLPEALVASMLGAVGNLQGFFGEFGMTAEQRYEEEQGMVEPEDSADEPESEFRDLAKGISPEQLEERYGIARSPHVAAYLVGFVPIVRVELADRSAFRAALDQFHKETGLEPEPRTHDGADYLHYGSPTFGSDVRVSLLRMTDEEVIVAFPREETVPTFVPYFTGERKPAESLADAGTLRQLRDKYGFGSFALGMWDFRRHMGNLTGRDVPGGLVGELVEVSGENDRLPTESAECLDGDMAMAEQMGRLVMGFRQFDERTFDYAIGLEPDEQLLSAIRETRSSIPGRASEPYHESALALGLGVKMAEFLALPRNPAVEKLGGGDCDVVMEWTDELENAKRISVSTPQAILSITGMTVLIDSLEVDLNAFSGPGAPSSPVLIDALAAIRTPNPSTLLAAARPLLPQLPTPLPSAGSEPLRLESFEQRSPIIDELYLAVLENAVGLTAGKGTGARFETLMAHETPDTPLADVWVNPGPPLRALDAALRERLATVQKNADQRPDLTAEDFERARKTVDKLAEQLPSEGNPMTLRISLLLEQDAVFASYRYRGKSMVEFAQIESIDEDIDHLMTVISPPRDR
ncbi:MAG: hypothetical protein ACQEVA_05045 [Myxococcota bacterium]